MKKVAIICVFSLFAFLIVLPVTRSVNPTLGNPTIQNGTLRADGFPLPPPVKLHRDSTSLVADGFPLPPPVKLRRDSTSLVADGFPLPPPVKLHRDSTAAFVNT
jgi:hypothetical protein